MTPTQLAEIEARAKAAAEGPWTWHWRTDDKDAPGSVLSQPTAYNGRAVAMCPRYGKKEFKKDAEFIAHARQDIPDLIAEVRRLRAEVKDMAQKGLDFAGAVAEGRYKHGETYD